MPKFTYAKGRIAESIHFITCEMKEFDKEYARLTWMQYQHDLKMQKLTDRTVENILNALIELCGALLAESGVAADNYAETLLRAAESFGLSRKKAGELSQLAFHRNRLVHRYLNMKWETIRAYKAQRAAIRQLLAATLDCEAKK